MRRRVCLSGVSRGSSTWSFFRVRRQCWFLLTEFHPPDEPANVRILCYVRTQRGYFGGEHVFGLKIREITQGSCGLAAVFVSSRAMSAGRVSNIDIADSEFTQLLGRGKQEGQPMSGGCVETTHVKW
ncbi:hypothetical protein Zmor_001898 [Zophobas morio]|uniref:Uncharacterized protein n=1 Tax=Zophobas morio TaxID=2755281 RepID=A0AA38MT26_9CUCU|nr:hypothetical protein Zmor_001898 [Zophobas morio]